MLSWDEWRCNVSQMNAPSWCWCWWWSFVSLLFLSVFLIVQLWKVIHERNSLAHKRTLMASAPKKKILITIRRAGWSSSASQQKSMSVWMPPSCIFKIHSYNNNIIGSDPLGDGSLSLCQGQEKQWRYMGRSMRMVHHLHLLLILPQRRGYDDDQWSSHFLPASSRLSHVFLFSQGECRNPAGLPWIGYHHNAQMGAR